MPGCLMGIDIGTTTAKGVLITTGGEVVAVASVEHEVSRPGPGLAEHDAEGVWWRDFVTVCRSLLAQSRINPGDILSVGCSGLYPVLVPVDKTGAPLRPAILYGIDTRSAPQIAALERDFGKDYSVAVSGNAITAQSIAPKLLWIKENQRDIFDRTEKFLFATGYIIHKLTGKMLGDRASASLGGLPYNIRTGNWDEDFCRRAAIPLEKLPHLCWSDERAGTVTASAAKETGLKEGTPVSCGCSDHAAEVLSLGAARPGTAVISYGSTFGLDVCSPKVLDYPGLQICVTGLDGQYLVGGGMAAGAAITKWFKDNLGFEEKDIENRTGENAYAVLSREAAAIPPGSEGLCALPYFEGERCPFFDPEATGAILGLGLRHTKAHIYRALLEGVAYGVAHVMETLRANGADFREAVSVGGGTLSDTWLGIVGDVTGLSQTVLNRGHGSSVGAAFTAGLAAGILERDAAEGWNRVQKTTRPNMKNHEIYTEYYRLYRRLYDGTRDIMPALRRLGGQASII